MRKFLEYSLGVFVWLNSAVCYAAEKFDILPDLPDPLLQKAEASTVSGAANPIVGVQSVGHEPSIISVILSLLFVVLLIYVTGILYAKLNKIGFNTLKKQQGELSKSRASVISTTQLGGNKTLHVVELDGKRMLIGASAGAIQLLKDLGSIEDEGLEEEYSRIEIPNIKIPKIEIPKIEIPSIGFSKIMTKAHKGWKDAAQETNLGSNENTEVHGEEGTNENIDETPDGIIDSLFTQTPEQEPAETKKEPTHTVDPEEFSLYKKYLG